MTGGQHLFAAWATNRNVTWERNQGLAGQSFRGQLLDPATEFIRLIPDQILQVALGLSILIIGWYVAKGLVQLAGRPVARRFDRPSIARTVLQGIRVGVLLIALGLIAQVFGFDPAEILLSVTVFSAVLAVVLAPIVGSFISGLFVLADRPYEIGDMIELVDEGTQGFVEDITLRYTKMFTLDNTFIVIPNSTIRERDIVNYSAEDERIRQSLDIVVTYEGNLTQARQAVERAARDVDAVISGGPDIRVSSVRYPAKPTCFINEFGDHGIRLRLRYWVEKPYRLPKVKSEVQANVWDALDELDVQIAYPHSQVVFDEHSGELPIRLQEEDTSTDATTAVRADGDQQPD